MSTRLTTFTVLGLAGLLSLAACDDDGTKPSASSSGGASSGGASSGGASSGGASSGGSSSGGNLPQEELSGDITASRTLAKTKTYLLKGLVQVKSGTTLTIEPGTIIKGDNQSKAILLVEPGAKLVAEGTENEPIVFTSQAAEGSRRPGDWGGVLILGNAPVNLPGGKGSVEGLLKTVKGSEYGGTDENDSSGVIRYVRIEYAGVELSKDNEVNGLTFAGVGRGTKVDHVQVRYALDDCFEFFGGTVDAKYLACQYNQDDGFDFDNGYRGRLQFLVLQQDPVHSGEDNGFESDNDATGSGNTPLTAPQVYNATIVGKNKTVDALSYGMLLRRNTRGTYRNLLVTGFPAAIDVRDASTAAGASDGSLSVSNALFFGSVGAGVTDHIAFPEVGATAPDKDNDGGFDEVGWFKAAGKENSWVDPKLAAPFSATTPGFGPATSLTQGAAAPPNDGFFDASASYIGAFKNADDAWARGKWAVWSDK
jgi:hypothetical protein